MSDKVELVIYEYAMDGNMGVEVEIATPSLTVQKLFPLPVSGLMAAILDFGSRQRRAMFAVTYMYHSRA